MKTMSKKELLKEIERIEDKIKFVQDADKLERYETRLTKAKSYFYECRGCDHSKTETYIGKDGEEKERFLRDCGKEKCPYHDYFVKDAVGN